MRSIRYAHLRSANAQRHHESISAKTPRRGNALRDAPPDGIMGILDALVAQPDRASDYESEGRRFESCRARRQTRCKWRVFSLLLDETNHPVGTIVGL